MPLALPEYVHWTVGAIAVTAKINAQSAQLLPKEDWAHFQVYTGSLALHGLVMTLTTCLNCAERRVLERTAAPSATLRAPLSGLSRFGG